MAQVEPARDEVCARGDAWRAHKHRASKERERRAELMARVLKLLIGYVGLDDRPLGTLKLLVEQRAASKARAWLADERPAMILREARAKARPRGRRVGAQRRCLGVAPIWRARIDMNLASVLTKVIGARGAEALSQAKHLAALEWLALYRADVEPAGVRALAESKHLAPEICRYWRGLLG